MSTSIGADVGAGTINGAAWGLVSMAVSWTRDPAAVGTSTADSWAAGLSDKVEAVGFCSTVVVEVLGCPCGDQNDLMRLLGEGLVVHVLGCMAEVHVVLVTMSVGLKKITSPVRCDAYIVA